MHPLFSISPPSSLYFSLFLSFVLLFFFIIPTASSRALFSTLATADADETTPETWAGVAGLERLTYFVRKTDRSGTIAAYEKGLVVGGANTGAPLLLTWRLVSAIVVTSPQLTRIQTSVETDGETIDQRLASIRHLVPISSSFFSLFLSSLTK